MAWTTWGPLGPARPVTRSTGQSGELDTIAVAPRNYRRRVGRSLMTVAIASSTVTATTLDPLDLGWLRRSEEDLSGDGMVTPISAATLDERFALKANPSRINSLCDHVVIDQTANTVVTPTSRSVLPQMSHLWPKFQRATRANRFRSPDQT